MTNWYFGEKKHFREKNICNGYKIFVTVTKIFFCNERLPNFNGSTQFLSSSGSPNPKSRAWKNDPTNRARKKWSIFEILIDNFEKIKNLNSII